MDQAREKASGGGASKGRPGRVDVGKRVAFYSESDKKTKYGVLRYFGEPEFAPGYWCGVELDQAEGKNNGSLQGIRYFSCEEGCGVFVPLSKVELDTGNKPKPKLQPGSDWQKKISAGRLLADVAGKARKTSAPKATAGGGGGGGRKPLKAFSLQDKQHGFPPTPLASKVRTIVPRAASSENLKSMTNAASGTAKKSSSERDLRNKGARTPDSARATPVGINLMSVPSSSRSVRSSSFSGFSREFPSSRTPSRSSVLSGPTFTDSYLSPYEGQSRAISPASTRDANATHFTLGEVVALRDLAAHKSPPSSYNLSNPSSVLSSGGEETGVSVETSHTGGSYLYFSWDGSPASDKIKPQDAHDALVHRLMDPTQSVCWGGGGVYCVMHVARFGASPFYVSSPCMQTDGLTVQEVVEALRHHLAVCQHNTGKNNTHCEHGWVEGGAIIDL